MERVLSRALLKQAASAFDGWKAWAGTVKARVLRVRDEIRMTIDAYKTLYDSSVTFGVRKQLQAEQGMGEMEDRIKSLQDTKRDLENQVLELREQASDFVG